MPTYYNFTENGVEYRLDDAFLPKEKFTTGKLFFWGNEYSASFDNVDKSTPVTTFAGGSNWKKCTISSFARAAIKTDGTLWTWGANWYGQAGVNDTTKRCTPVTTFAGGTNWVKVSSGYANIAAIKTDGTLWIWGSDWDGQLGNGTSQGNPVYTPITTFAGGTDWKDVFLGYRISYAIKTDGT